MQENYAQLLIRTRRERNLTISIKLLEQARSLMDQPQPLAGEAARTLECLAVFLGDELRLPYVAALIRSGDEGARKALEGTWEIAKMCPLEFC